eukprot:COSAG03_NODE_6553_length_1041_cov_1.158174_1_plen_106_part_00
MRRASGHTSRVRVYHLQFAGSARARQQESRPVARRCAYAYDRTIPESPNLSSANPPVLRGAHTVDESAGYGATPYSTRVLTGEELQLAPSAYVLLELAGNQTYAR